MSTLTLSLEENIVERLRDRAAGLGVSVEEYTATLLHDHTQPIAITPSEFKRLLTETLKNDDEVYRRLAQ